MNSARIDDTALETARPPQTTSGAEKTHHGLSGGPQGHSASAAAAAIAEATALAGSILGEISRRWPGQAGGWVRDGELVAAWGRGILEARAAADPRGLRAALAKLTARAYPPDLGALLAEVTAARTISEHDAHRSMLRVLRALSSRDLSACSREELYALKNYPGGSWEFKTEAASPGQTKRWRDLLNEAAGLPDDQLPPAVAKPAGYLEEKITDEDRRRRGARLAALKAMLA